MHRVLRSLVFCVSAVFALLALPLFSSAQITAPGYALRLSRPLLTTFPPLDAGMSPDVLVGYRYLDSIRRSVSPSTANQIIKRLTNSDTLRWANKFLFEIDDNDPALFAEYLRSSPHNSHYKLPGAWLTALLNERDARVMQDRDRTLMLCHSDIIAHVIVNNVQPVYDNAYGAAYPNQIIVSCSVLDTIKGRILPSCLNDKSIKDENIRNKAVSNCLQFCYSPQEPLRGGSGDSQFGPGTMQDSLGNPLVKVGDEYIAYLSIAAVGTDSASFYYSIFPAKWHTTQGGLYQVVAGNVSDPNNDLEFGSSNSLAEYLASLRSAIHSLTHP